MKNIQAYCNNYFETNYNYIKGVWKGIKSLISLKIIAFSLPSAFSLDNEEKNWLIITHRTQTYISTIEVLQEPKYWAQMFLKNVSKMTLE